MTDHKTFAIAAMLCALMVATPAAVGQAVEWQGQDSEFGSIRAPYTATMEGDRVPVEARIVLRENYEEKDSRFFMFAFTVENTPLNIEFDNLVRMDTGEELPCYQRQGDSTSAIKCFVDLKDMPPAGTEIRMYGTVGSSKTGLHQIGAMVVPFTYTWLRVQMSNGLNAELYAGTQLNVKECPGGKCGLGGRIQESNPVPGVGLLGAAAAGAIAVGLVALRRRA